MRDSSRLAPLLLLVFAGLLMQTLPAVEVVAGPEVVVSETTAMIQWTTDVQAGTKVSYGTSEGLLSNRAEGGVASKHLVELKALTPGTTYYYSFGTARVQLGKGKFTTSGLASNLGAPLADKKTLLQKILSKIVPVTKPASTPLPAVVPPARQTWGYLDSLQDHFVRHGRDFNATSPDDYAGQAWLFLQRAKRDGLPMKWDDADGSLRVFDPETRAFASYDRRGKTRTYFRPNNPGYWARQPGRAVTAAQLAF